MMASLSRDITLTLVVKLILLFILWWVCIKHFHPALQSRSHWLLGVSNSSTFSSVQTHEVYK